jgi:uncharacterized repeat protein (TIGR02543 family)
VGVAYAVYSAFANGKDRAAATEKFEKAVLSWTGEVSAYDTDYEKVLAIHDLICENTEYDYGILNADGTVNISAEQSSMSQSAYSTFILGKTVCAGYAQACELLCNAVGIDAIVVTSAVHEWNKVRIDDSWYNVDCTWDDQGVQSYTFFAKSDYAYDYELSASASHQEEDCWSGYLPECTLDSGSTMAEAGTLPAVTGQTKKVTISATPVYATDKKTGEKYIKTYKVKMTCATKGAKIYYTTDGSTPSVAFSKAKKYQKAFKIKDPSKLKAIAVCDQKTDSNAVSFTYKIKYDGNGATSGSMSAKTCKYGKTYKLAANKYKKKGYTFAGWNTKKNGKGKTYKNKASIKNLASKSGKTITLYAQWKKK